MPADFYDLLDVPADASREDIKRAYRSKAGEYHPDVNPDDRAEVQFKTVRRAYEVLSDPEERDAYDRMGHETYLARRVDGLPTTGWTPDDADDATGREAETRSRTGSRAAASGGGRRRTSGRARGSTDGSSSSSSSSDRGRTDDPFAGRAEQFTHRRRQQRRALRRRRIAVELLAGVGVVAYAAGLWVAVTAARDAVGSLVDALRTAGPDGLAAALGDGYGLDFAATAVTAVDAVSVGLLFPAGALLLPAGVCAAVRWRRRRVAAAVAVASLGPVAGLAAEAGAGLDAAWIDVVCYALLPGVAAVGWAALAARWVRALRQ